MKPKIKLFFLILILLISNNDVRAQDNKTYKVIKVVDGDTLDLTELGRVRLIGVDTPETVHPKKPVQYFGKEASNYLTGLADGKIVKIEYDQQKKDRYGRYLAYVFLIDGTFINAEIIKNGFGHAYTQYPFRKMDEFRSYEKEARVHNKGLWGSTNAENSIPIKIKSASSSDCSRKTCSQITSCSEARYLLEKCNHKFLDGNRDGIPCNSLCR